MKGSNILRIAFFSSSRLPHPLKNNNSGNFRVAVLLAFAEACAEEAILENWSSFYS
jgi:hypothetical protein